MISLFDLSQLAKHTLSQISRRAAYEARMGQRPEKAPTALVLKEILSTLFHVSLRTEEGRPIQVRLFYADPQGRDRERGRRYIDQWQFYDLTDRIPFTTENLAKFAKAADSWTTGIAVHHNTRDGLYIWGILDQVVHFSTGLVHESSGGYLLPGVFHAAINGPADVTIMIQNGFVARQAQDRFTKRENQCLEKGEISGIIRRWTKPLFDRVVRKADQQGIHRDRYRWEPFLHYGWIRSVSRVLLNIQRQRHGGSLIIAPENVSDGLAMKYRIDYEGLAEALQLMALQTMITYGSHDEVARLERGDSVDERFISKLRENDRNLEDSHKSVTGAIRCVASFAGVDGAVLLDPTLSVRGFGVFIGINSDLNEVRLTSTERAMSAKAIDMRRFGTRHQSMFRYCFANPGVLGFVVSQDGEIRAITRVRDACVVYENVKLQYSEDFI